MLTGWSRAFLLFAAAALVANTQCYGACATVPCGSAQTRSGSCHHNESAHEKNAGCVHHSEFTGPEVGVAKVHVATWFPILAVLTAAVTIAAPERLQSLHAANGSPPRGRIYPTVSVLRI